MRIRENTRLAHSRCSMDGSRYPLSTLNMCPWKVLWLDRVFWEVVPGNISDHELNLLASLWEAFLKPQKCRQPHFFLLIVFSLNSLSQEYEFPLHKRYFLFKQGLLQKHQKAGSKWKLKLKSLEILKNITSLQYSFFLKNCTYILIIGTAWLVFLSAFF